MKKFVILASVLILTVAFVSAVPAADIKVGTLMAQTGPLKEYGPPIKDGAVLAGKQMPLPVLKSSGFMRIAKRTRLRGPMPPRNW